MSIDPSAEETVLLDRLRAMWDRRDPAPVDLVDRVLFAVWLEDLDTEVEMLTMTEHAGLVGARATETARTVTFSTDELSILISVSDRPEGLRRVDGWVSPKGEGEVTLRRSDGTVSSTAVDEDGRFALDDLPAGLAQLVLHRGDDRPLVAAPPIEL
jgi:hypothetical protein